MSAEAARKIDEIEQMWHERFRRRLIPEFRRFKSLTDYVDSLPPEQKTMYTDEVLKDFSFGNDIEGAIDDLFRSSITSTLNRWRQSGIAPQPRQFNAASARRLDEAVRIIHRHEQTLRESVRVPLPRISGDVRGDVEERKERSYGTPAEAASQPIVEGAAASDEVPGIDQLYNPADYVTPVSSPRNKRLTQSSAESGLESSPREHPKGAGEARSLGGEIAEAEEEVKHATPDTLLDRLIRMAPHEAGILGRDALKDAVGRIVLTTVRNARHHQGQLPITQAKQIAVGAARLGLSNLIRRSLGSISGWTDYIRAAADEYATDVAHYLLDVTNQMVDQRPPIYEMVRTLVDLPVEELRHMERVPQLEAAHQGIVNREEQRMRENLNVDLVVPEAERRGREAERVFEETKMVEGDYGKSRIVMPSHGPNISKIDRGFVGNYKLPVLGVYNLQTWRKYTINNTLAMLS